MLGGIFFFFEEGINPFLTVLFMYKIVWAFISDIHPVISVSSCYQSRICQPDCHRPWEGGWGGVGGWGGGKIGSLSDGKATVDLNE